MRDLYVIDPVTASNFVSSLATKTANYTATTSDEVLLCDATTASFTVTLPAASGNNKLKLTLKKIDSSANTVTIDGNVAETIDGQTTIVIAQQHTSYEIVCDGSNWHAV